MDEKVVVGQILKAQGIKGEVKVKPICDDPARYLSLKNVYIEPAAEEGEVSIACRVLNCRLNGGFAYLYLDKIVSRDAAESVSGQFLKVDREDVVLEEGRYLISDVMGSEVLFEDGEPLGSLEDILQTYAVDTYCVRTPKGRVLFPAVAKAVLRIDPGARRIVLSRKGFEEVSVYED